MAQHYIARAALPVAMAGPELLPRIVTRGETALSWDGPVPWSKAVEGVDQALGEFGKVLVWDLDGIERNRPNLGLVHHFEGDSLWVDAGVRRVEGIIDVLVAGAERAVVGTKTLRSMEELEDALDLTDNVVPLLDFADGSFRATDKVRTLAPAELLRRCKGLGLDAALFVDEESKVPPAVLQEAPEGMALFAGVVRKDDVASLPPRTGAIVDIWEVVQRKT
jgi:hypothetical protein